MTYPLHTISFERTIDSHLSRISIFILLNASITDNTGLFNGKLGFANFFCHFFRYTCYKMFKDFTGELIDDISEEVNLTTQADYENCQTGIEQGIQGLNEILSEIQSLFIKPLTNNNVEISFKQTDISRAVLSFFNSKVRAEGIFEDNNHIKQFNILRVKHGKKCIQHC